MILADTSVWITYLRGEKGAQPLSRLLASQQVISHPWIYMELALGHLGKQRKQILSDIDQLHKLQEYPWEEIRDFIEHEHLYGKGLSFVDSELLYASLVENHALWTEDQALRSIANQYGASFTPPS